MAYLKEIKHENLSNSFLPNIGRSPYIHLMEFMDFMKPIKKRNTDLNNLKGNMDIVSF